MRCSVCEYETQWELCPRCEQNFTRVDWGIAGGDKTRYSVRRSIMASTIIRGIRFETSKFMSHIPDDHFLKPSWIGMQKVRCVNEKTFKRLASCSEEELGELLKSLKPYTPVFTTPAR